MAWVLLAIAGLLEVVWAYFMKQSAGFTKVVPTAITFAAMLASIGLLAAAMKSLPLGTAYGVWTGIGAVGAFIVGIVVLNEPASLPRIAAAGLIVSGMVLMRLATPG